MAGKGWIKLHRELTDKAIWLESTPEQKTILVTLLMMANHEENEWEWKGERCEVGKGQFITSLESITKKCGKGVSVQNVRTALKRFEKYEFLTNESTNKNRLITIVNWASYQGNEENQQANQQATNKQLTTNKNERTKKNINIVDSKENLTVHKEIINYLNLKAGTRYRPSTKATQKHINARLNEGFTLDDFKTVIDVKVDDWLSDKKMNIYLRPETLFSPKFESYLNQSQINGSNSDEIVTNDDGSFSLR